MRGPDPPAGRSSQTNEGHNASSAGEGPRIHDEERQKHPCALPCGAASWIAGPNPAMTGGEAERPEALDRQGRAVANKIAPRSGTIGAIGRRNDARDRFCRLS